MNKVIIIGGGFGGIGGQNPAGWGGVYPANFSASNMSLSSFDLGSGGGAGYASHYRGFPIVGGHSWGCSSGGNGGGTPDLTSGTANTGSGGGGGTNNATAGGNGGSGLVIVRYLKTAV